MGSAMSWRTRVWGVVLVNLATTAWASNAVVGRLLHADVGPLTLTAIRFSLATALMSLALRGRPVAERRYGRDKWWLMGMGAAGVMCFSPLLYLGLHYSTAVNSSLIQGFSPLITALIAGAIISEPVTRRETVGAVLGLIGIVGLLSGGSMTYLWNLQFNRGDLLLLAAAIAWAFYTVFSRRVMLGRSPVSAIVLSGLFGLPFMLVAAAIELQYVSLNLRWDTIAGIAHISLVPTMLGYWAWNRGVGILGAGGAMVFYNTLPLFGALLGALALGEPLGPVHAIFGGIILLGGLWTTLGRG